MTEAESDALAVARDGNELIRPILQSMESAVEDDERQLFWACILAGHLGWMSASMGVDASRAALAMAGQSFEAAEKQRSEGRH